MGNPFFDKPILNSPYEYPQKHWELDEQGQPTQRTIETRRQAKFFTPIPKPRKRKVSASQKELVYDEGKGLSTEHQQYDPVPIINELRYYVDQWRSLPNPNDWQVTPETARLQRDSEHDSNFRLDFHEDGTVAPVVGEVFRLARMNPLTSQSGSETTIFSYGFQGKSFKPKKGGWKTNFTGMERLCKAQRLTYSGKTLGFVRPFNDYGFQRYSDIWDDTRQSGFGDEKRYVVQTAAVVVERCLLLASDPGDLVLDPTCGSGTTAYVAEKWGRRWITVDTSRVALALTRARIMGARYPYYLLADSRDGQLKEAEIARTVPSEVPTRGDVRQGFVYERVAHITLKSIANNAEIDVIWGRFQEVLEPLRKELNSVLGQRWEEWEIPRDSEGKWPEKAKILHGEWWQQRIDRQREIDASIAAKADYENLYDKPYVDNRKARVAGPFSVESLSPHRALSVDENDELFDSGTNAKNGEGEAASFVQMILDNLKTAGVQQAHKEDKIDFTSIAPWPGHFVCAEGLYSEQGKESSAEKRAAIFVGPEFGTVSRPDLVAAAREAGDGGHCRCRAGST